MRFSTAYYLFLLYLTAVFQPLAPLIYDGLSHTFENAVHITMVHAKYGNNHVEITLAETNGDRENTDHNAVKAEEQVPAHFAADEYAMAYPLTNIHSKYLSKGLFNLSCAFIAKQLPPPKFS